MERNFKISNKKMNLVAYLWKGLFKTKSLINVFFRETIINGITGYVRKYSLSPLSQKKVTILENYAKKVQSI